MKKLLLCFVLLLALSFQLLPEECSAFFVGFGATGGVDNVVKQGQDSGLIPLIPEAGLPPGGVKQLTNAETVWKAVYDLGNDGEICGVAMDKLGNMYIVGDCTGTFSATYDCVLIKFKANGDTDWLQFYDGGGDDFGKSVAVDSGGNVIVAGTSNNGGNWDCFTVKFNSAGDPLWRDVYDSGTSDAGRGVACDNAGNIYVGAKSGNTMTIIKYDSGGNTLMAKRIPKKVDDCQAIALDGSGNIFLIGYVTNANADWIIFKCDPSGDTLWQKLYDSGSHDYGRKIITDASGNAYACGSAGGDYFFVEYSSAGDSLLSKRYDSGKMEYPYGISVDASGNIYEAGYGGNGGVFDWLTIKYDSSGNTVWQMPYDSGNNGDYCQGVIVDANNNVYVAGYYDDGITTKAVLIKYRQY